MTGAGAPDAYAAAGVDIDAGNETVARIAGHLARTARREVTHLAGGFAAGFALDTARYRNPVLVSGADGVGTKVLLAARTGRWRGIGIDAVAMCVNDVIVTGAEPLFFLDYLATGQLDPGIAEQVVAGVADGCAQAGCSLVGGETAEMPGMYAPGDLDIAGFCVGVVEQGCELGPHRVTTGDVLVGLASRGVHANGFSLVRHLLDQHDIGLGERLGVGTVADALLEPTRIYAGTLRRLVERFDVHAAAHITGGGLVENVPRMLPPGLRACIDVQSWQVPEVHAWLCELAGGDTGQLYRVLNMGIGMVVAIPPDQVSSVISCAAECGDSAVAIGVVERGSGGVRLGQVPAVASRHHPRAGRRRPAIAILASGNGSNAQALIDASRYGSLDATIACVVCDRHGAPVVDRARRASVDVVELDPDSFAGRDAYEQAMVAELHGRNVDLVVLAGYMRICGRTFLSAFEGRAINIHPSLLPAFPGRDAIGDALAGGVQVTGVTVHFIDAGVDTGPIIAQAPVSVAGDDTRDTLAARIHRVEHELLVRTVRDLVTGIRHPSPNASPRQHLHTLVPTGGPA